MFNLFGQNLESRFFLGTSLYPSPESLRASVEASKAQVVTVSIRRNSSSKENGFWQIIKDFNVRILPNTAGCRTVKEAVTTAHMTREIFGTNWVKLETVGDDYTLQPDPFALVEAARILCEDGFEVFPYMTDDLVVADRLISVGCKVLMHWASPIGSAKGIINPAALSTMRKRFTEAFIVVDAGLGAPSHAALAMELGADAVLLNSAVALSHDPPLMAEAFKNAISAGRQGFEAGLMKPRDFAQASTPILGTPFWQTEKLATSRENLATSKEKVSSQKEKPSL